jgi:hypothetical protein
MREASDYVQQPVQYVDGEEMREIVGGWLRGWNVRRN